MPTPKIKKGPRTIRKRRTNRLSQLPNQTNRLSQLPSELILNISERLPGTSLGRFRTVSTPFQNIPSTGNQLRNQRGSLTSLRHRLKAVIQHKAHLYHAPRPNTNLAIHIKYVKNQLGRRNMNINRMTNKANIRTLIRQTQTMPNRRRMPGENRNVFSMQEWHRWRMNHA